MSFNNILTLFLQGSLVAFIILLLFKLRKILGIGVLYACIGLFQFVQVMSFIINTAYSSYTSIHLVTPGSSVFITITLFALLIVYIKEDAIETKKMFYAILIVNILINFIFLVFFWDFNKASSENLSVANKVFSNTSKFIVGNIALFLDIFLLITVFEFLSKKTKFLFVQILTTMLIVASFDTIFFSIFVFWKSENLGSIIISGLISKNSFTIYYSILFYIYLRYLDKTDKDLVHFTVKDVFKPLTYKQKFNTAVSDIKKANEMYRILTDNSNDIICLQEPDSSFKYISPSIKKVLGYEQSYFLGKKIFDIVHKDDLQDLIDSIEQKIYRDNKTTDVLTFRLLHKKGYYVWIEYNTSPIYNEKNIISFVSSARDVTQRVLANNQFKTSLKLLKKREYSLNESSKIGKVGFIEFKAETNNYIWSDYLYSIFGITPSKKPPSSEEFLLFFTEDYQQIILDKIKNLKENGEPFNIEAKSINNLWLKLIIEPVFNDKNVIIGRRGIIQDITSYKTTQIRLQKSLTLLKQREFSLNEASNVAKIGYFEYDIPSDTFKWSDYLYHIYGLELGTPVPSRNEIVKMIDKDSLSTIKNATLDLDLKGIPYDIEMKIFNKKTNKGVWIRSVAQPIYNDKKEIVGRKGVAQDITEYKNNQLKIQNSLNLLEQKDEALNQSSKIAKIGYWEYNISKETFTWSDSVYKIYGLDKNDKIPSRKEMIKLYDEEYQEKIEKATLNLITNKIPYDLELKLTNFKQKEVWIRNVVYLIYNEKNEIIGRRGVVHDITESKNNQLELERREFLLNESGKIAKIGGWEVDLVTQNVRWTDQVYEIHGLPITKVPTPEEVMSFYIDGSREVLEKAIEKCLTENKSYDLVLRFQNKQNKKLWVNTIGYPVLNKEGVTIGLRGVVHDITESKTNQLELERREFLLNESGKLAKIGGWELDLETQNIRWSDEVFEIHGLPIGEVPPIDECIGFYIDGSDKIIEKAIQDSIAENKKYDLVLRFLNKQNQKLWVNAIGYPITDKNGVTIGIRGIIQDITEQKSKQDELDIQNEKLNKLNNELKEAQKISKLGNWEYNIASDKVTWSKEVHNIFKLPIELGAPNYDEHKLIFSEKSYTLMNEAVQNCIEHQTPYHLELDINTPEGLTKYITIRGKVLKNKESNVIGCYGTIQDITTLKSIQIELENKNKKINQSLKLLERNEFSKNETSKVAKIGYHEYYNITDSFYWSDYMLTIFGLDKDQKIPDRTKLVSLFDKESKAKLIKATDNLETYGLPYDLELKLTNFKKEDVWIRMSNQPIFNHQNKIIGRRGIGQNITERKKIEEENQKIKNDYIKLFDNATISIWNEDLTLFYKEIDKLKKLNITDIHLYLEENPDVLFNLSNKVKINYVNKATLDLFEANNQQEFLQNIHLSFGKGAERVFLKLIAAIWNNLKTFTTEVNYKTLKGEEFTAILSVAIPQTIDEQKTVPVSIQSIQNIKDAEFALKESLKELKEAQKLGRLGNWIINPFAKEFIWSDEVFYNLGFDPKDGYPNYDEVMTRIHPDDIEFHNKKFDDATNLGIPFDMEIRTVIPNKKEKTIRLICEPIKDDNGKVIKLKGVNQDITEQKNILRELEKTNKKIKQSLELLKISEHSRNEISKIAKIGYQDYDSVTNTYIWSDYFYDILGFDSKKGFPNKEEKIRIFYRESQIKLKKAFDNLEKKGVPFDLELKLFDKDKGTVWVRYLGQPVFNSDNKIIGRRGIIQNITDQIIKQKRLDDQNEKLFNLNNALNEAQEISKVGNWEYITNKEEITWSKELFNIFERSLTLGPPRNYSELISYYTEDSYNILQTAIANCLNNKVSFNVQLDIYSSNGDIKHVTTRGKVLYDKNNTAIGCYGTTQDITEQRQILDEIKRTQELYRLVTENSTDIICLLGRDTTLKYVSPSANILLGYNIDDYLGKQVFDIIHNDDTKLLKESINQRKLKNNYDGSFTVRVRHKKGHFIWMEALSSPVYTNNQISYFVISARNVTNMMLAKQEIQEYQSSLQKLTTEITLIEENQKREIATNIHDHLSQSLVISKMKINSLKKNPALKIIDKDLQFIDTHISDALTNSRKITYDLSPPVLYQLGIIEALNWLLNDVEAKHKIKCVFNDNVEDVTLDDTKSILLFRSIQEVLNNAIKYAKASLITLNLNKDKFGLKIIILDDGVGFDTTLLKKHNNHTGSGFGLFTVQERIKNINGEFVITSIINKGTTVNIFIPL
ncbi:PAS domain-containing protein [Polaribacter sp. Asnod1-A03]|uniref:PAS domain-containing protein n=1 Tax=Polaribacter sp. Asnod1-A03 TaxID=3160581 RepID=UPI003862E7A9